MLPVIAHRTRVARALCVLSAVLVLAIGCVQAVHSHPINSQTSHHSCSICSVPSLGPVTATVSVLPTVRPVAMAPSMQETFEIYRPASTNFVRPPPAV